MKYGRLPRARNPAIPHLSAMLAGVALPVVPPQVSWTAGMPPDLGMLGNNSIGDCAEAGFSHCEQIWTYHTQGTMYSPTTQETEDLYSEVTGYKPGDPATDRGTVLQELLAYLVKTGAPKSDGIRQKLFAFVEVDPQRVDHLNLVTFQTGLVYLGFNVPKYLEAQFSPGTVWDVNPSADNTIVGGHCVISGGYQPDGTREIVSWGSAGYRMTPAFWAKYVDEAYALISTEWLERSGRTFAGFTMDQLEQQMAALKEAA